MILPLLPRLSLLLFSPRPLHDPSSDVDQDRDRDTQPHEQHRLYKLIRTLVTPVSTPQRCIKVVFGSKVALPLVLGVSPVPCPLKQFGYKKNQSNMIRATRIQQTCTGSSSSSRRASPIRRL